MADKKPTYAGQISHAGVQSVKAPISVTTAKGTGTVKKGADLRK